MLRRAVALLTAHHADIAADSPRLRYALECWTGLNRAATSRWLRGEATREATQELLASTLEYVLRTFGARSAPSRRFVRSAMTLVEGTPTSQLLAQIFSAAPSFGLRGEEIWQIVNSLSSANQRAHRRTLS